MSLRRRLSEGMDARDRELHLSQARVASLEAELRGVNEDMSRLRRSGYSGGSAMPLPSHGHYYMPPTIAPPPPASASVYSRDRDRGYEREGDREIEQGYGGYRGYGQDQIGDREREADPPSRIGQAKSLRGALGRDSDRDRGRDRGREPAGPAEYDSSQPSSASGPRSLAALVGGGGAAVPSTYARGGVNKPRPSSSSSPFATESTSSAMRDFENLERELTVYMTEKTALEEELARSSPPLSYIYIH
jgi:hypothetical protein